jgi:hypothetical protein
MLGACSCRIKLASPCETPGDEVVVVGHGFADASGAASSRALERGGFRGAGERTA